MSFIGYVGISRDNVVLAYLIRQSLWDVLFIWLFTFCIFLIMEVFIMNLLIGIIITLTNIYSDNTKE